MAAAYMACKLGMHPAFHNRTMPKAEELAVRFNGRVVADIPPTEPPAEADSGLLNVAVVMNTLPASVGWAAPAWLLETQRPVVFDVAYIPAQTPLLAQAAAAGCQTVGGRAMIVTQAAVSNALWQGKAAVLLRKGSDRSLGGPAAACIDFTSAVIMNREAST